MISKTCKGFADGGSNHEMAKNQPICSCGTILKGHLLCSMPNGSAMNKIRCGKKPQERRLEQHCDEFSQEFSVLQVSDLTFFWGLSLASQTCWD